ncbi:MAG: PKD domain-containing protein [Hymenobacteraceae bacterium]|nr:PKD domain-containing protein [Hymenobacteraceae bacterium]
MRSLLRYGLWASALTLGALSPAYAQQRVQQRGSQWCATDAHTAALRATFHDPVMEAQRAAAEVLAARMQADDVLARAMSSATGHIVPTVIHVLTPCGGTTVTKQQILNGFQVMQQDWLRRNPDTTATRSVFKPYAASLDIEFRLAQLDPRGNATDGIHRVTTSAKSTADGPDPVKDVAPYWPKCFNIWLVPNIGGDAGGGTILGYGQFPGTGPWSTWGFVMRTDTWTGAFGANNRTASHEVGHCFNLFHSFTDGGGCGSSNCTASGDGVCDTPPHASATQGCSRSQNTCANDVGPGSPYTTNVVDQIENYMSYDDCQNMFSRGQKARVDAAFQNIPYLRDLASPANQLATGVADGQVVPSPAPIAYVSTCQLSQLGGTYVACQGQPVTFADVSYGAPIVSRRWTFSNASPATDSSTTPTVVFTAAGRQTVTLVVTGRGGVVSAPLTLEVRVLPGGTLVAPFQESFEVAGVDTIFQVGSSNSNAAIRR